MEQKTFIEAHKIINVLKDSKAVSPVIGFILLLQILIIFLAFVQTTVVPDQLKKIEFDNVRSLRSEMVKFSAMLSSGSNAYLLVKTPEYPDYLFLLTPEPAGFSIWTEPFKINVSADIVLPNGSKMSLAKSYETRRIYVQMNNYFYPDTTLIFENTAVFQRNNGDYGIASEQSIVRNGVYLIIIQSEISEAYNSPHEFSFKTISSGGRYYAENITVEFTSINPDYWKEIGFSVSGRVVRTNITSGAFSIMVVSDLERKTGVSYLIKTNPFDSYSFSIGDSKEFGVLALDNYLNPVSGVQIDASISGGVGSVTPQSLETDSSGAATVSFIATSPGNGEIVFSSGNFTLNYSITVIQPQTGNGSSLIQVDWLNSSGIWDAGAGGGKRVLALRVTDSQSTPIPGIDVRFSVTNTSVITLNTTTALTDSNGIVRVQAFARANGSVKVYAFAGDAGDVLSLSVVNVTTFWLTGWSYRVPVTIQENSGSSLTDYQVLVSLNASFNWSAVNGDGSDIRFTDIFGNLLSYWIEEWSYGSGAKIWVKVPTIPAGGTATVYMYYGNSTASSASSGVSTFIYFDHFDSDSSPSYTVWESWSNANPTFIWNPANSEVATDTSNADYFLTANVNLPQSFAVEVRAYTEDDDSLGALIRSASGEFYIASMRVSHYDGTGISGTEETLILYSAPPTYYWQATLLSSFGDVVNPSSWQVAGIAYHNGYISALYNHAKSGSYYVGAITPESPGLSSQANNPPAHYDWILVRKYIEPEPAVTIGPEERSG